VQKAKTFYTELFGWSFADNDGYTTIYNKGNPIGGIINIAHKPDTDKEAVWLPSMSVQNVDKAVNTVIAHKGMIIKGPLDMQQRGRGALVSDALGAHIVLLHAKGGDPLDSDAKMGDWLWNELWTSNADKSSTLYSKLGGYDLSKTKTGYAILESNDIWRAGIREVSKEGVKSRWVGVVRVSNLQNSMDKVIKLGGKVRMKPHKEIANGNVAVISDNTGALLVIQRWSHEIKGGK